MIVHEPYEIRANEFLEYLLTSKDIVKKISTEHFLSFLASKGDFGILKIKDAFLSVHISNLNYLYQIFYKSFQVLQQICTECNTAHSKIVQLLFISRLDYLETLVQGRQIVQLSSSVNRQLERISSVRNSIQEAGNFRTVEHEKSVIKQIVAEAESLMTEKIENKMEIIKVDVDNKLEELVKISQDLQKEYAKNIEKLEIRKKELTALMAVKYLLILVEMAFGIARPFAPKVGGIGAAIASATSKFLPNQKGETYEPEIPKALSNAKKISSMFGQQKSQRVKLEKIMKEVITTEQIEGDFLSPEHRQMIQSFLNETNKNLKSLEQTADNLKAQKAIDAVIMDLSVKISIMKTDQNASNEKKIDAFNQLISKLNKAKYIADSDAGSVGIEMIEKATSPTELEQVKASIEMNKIALKEMALYEKSLQEEFKPMVDEMISTLEQFNAGLKDKNAIELVLEKYDVKEYARKCIQMVNKFTQGFVEKEDGLESIFADLQDFLTSMIDANDKISEMQYRAQLANFMGQLQGGQCSDALTSDPVTCNSFLQISTIIRSNEIIREFLFVFTAYQQVLFPYGGEKIGVLKSTLSLLMGSSNMTAENVIFSVRPALETIQKDLAELSESILNHKDKNVVVADFNSKYISSSSFFVWPKEKYSQQIEALLSGEQVTLVASVLAPEVRNAVKFHTAMLNFTSKDVNVKNRIDELLRSFEVEMIHGGESYFRCGSRFYAIGGDKLTFTTSFERNEKGELVSRNKVFEKLKYGDVPLSPYTVWKFRLVHVSSKTDPKLRHSQLAKLAKKVDLELVGQGYYVKEEAPICDSDLGQFYNSFDNYFL